MYIPVLQQHKKLPEFLLLLHSHASFHTYLAVMRTERCKRLCREVQRTINSVIFCMNNTYPGFDAESTSVKHNPLSDPSDVFGGALWSVTEDNQSWGVFGSPSYIVDTYPKRKHPIKSKNLNWQISHIQCTCMYGFVNCHKSFIKSVSINLNISVLLMRLPFSMKIWRKPKILNVCFKIKHKLPHYLKATAITMIFKFQQKFQFLTTDQQNFRVFITTCFIIACQTESLTSKSFLFQFLSTNYKRCNLEFSGYYLRLLQIECSNIIWHINRKSPRQDIS